MKYIDVNGMEWSTKKGFSAAEIEAIKKKDAKFLHEVETEKAKERYFKMCTHIQNVGFDRHIDMCVDAENIYPLKEADGEEYWSAMYDSMVYSVGSRLEEEGICASDYGIPY